MFVIFLLIFVMQNYQLFNKIFVICFFFLQIVYNVALMEFLLLGSIPHGESIFFLNKELSYKTSIQSSVVAK